MGNEAPTKTNKPIASREFFAKDNEGKQLVSLLEIWAPQATSDGDYSCRIGATGIEWPVYMVYGGDSWQALQIAYEIIGDLLNEFVEGGGKLFWPGSEIKMLLRDFIPQANCDRAELGRTAQQFLNRV